MERKKKKMNYKHNINIRIDDELFELISEKLKGENASEKIREILKEYLKGIKNEKR